MGCTGLAYHLDFPLSSRSKCTVQFKYTSCEFSNIVPAVFSLEHCNSITSDPHGCIQFASGSVPEIIDPVFAKTSQNARFLLSENEHFGLVFVKTGSINSGTGLVSHSVW
jgi:hypothetical protein